MHCRCASMRALTGSPLSCTRKWPVCGWLGTVGSAGVLARYLPLPFPWPAASLPDPPPACLRVRSFCLAVPCCVLRSIVVNAEHATSYTCMHSFIRWAAGRTGRRGAVCAWEGGGGGE